MLVDPSIFPEDLPPRMALYQTFLKLVNSIKWNNQKIEEPSHPGLDAVRRNLDVLAPAARQAFLLISVEEFSPSEAATILDVDESELQELIDEAGREIARQIATDVVIIEVRKALFKAIKQMEDTGEAPGIVRDPEAQKLNDFICVSTYIEDHEDGPAYVRRVLASRAKAAE